MFVGGGEKLSRKRKGGLPAPDYIRENAATYRQKFTTERTGILACRRH